MENFEVLKLKERLELATEIGESYYREFKSAFEGPPGKKLPREPKEICYDIAKTLVAFSNADGGELYIGIEDDNSMTGVPHSANQIESFLKSSETHVLKDTPLPLKKSTVINYNALKVLYFSVDKGSKFIHQTSKGECFQRKDRESVPTSLELIRYERDEQISREYDRQFVDLATIIDLDLDLLNAVSKQIFNRSLSAEKLLQHFDLAEFDGTRLKLRKAALLLFSKNIIKWHPRTQVRLLKVGGIIEKTGEDFNIKELADINENIFKLIETAWESLRPYLTETRFSKDGIFKTQIIYPELACKEALVNAIVHRDYSLEGRGIEIKIFDDRLEIVSPGKLLSSITIKELQELKGAYQTRNTYIAKVLREYGYIRELGEGIKRIFNLMSQNELVPPEFTSPNKSFIVTLFYKYIYSREEKLWLDNFESLGLSREEKTVVKLGINGQIISPNEIWENVGIVDTENYSQLIKRLQVLGILDTVIDRNQAGFQAKKNGVLVKSIPQFKILLPGEKPDSIEKIQTREESEYAKIYVANLDRDMTPNDLLEFFSHYGNVEDVKMPKDFTTKKNKGYAFVEFESEEIVKKLLNDHNPKILNNRRLYIQEFKK